MTSKQHHDKPVELNDTDLEQAAGAGNTVPTESISLNYEKITWTYSRSGDAAIKDGTSNTFLVGERDA